MTIDLNDGTHSRHRAEHYETCQFCYEDHLDFMEEERQDALADEASEMSENE